LTSDGEVIEQAFSLPLPCFSNPVGYSDLSFAAQRFAHLRYYITDFAAHFAYFLLNLFFPAFIFSFDFKAWIVSHFPDLGFHRALDLFIFAFDLIFVPHTCLLEMIVSLEVEL
jgi:hypothetical protein